MDDMEAVKTIVGTAGPTGGIVIGWLVFSKLQRLEKDLVSKFDEMRQTAASEFSKIREELIELKHKTGRVADLENKAKEMEAWRARTSIYLERITAHVNRLARHQWAQKAQVHELSGSYPGPITEELLPPDP